LAQQVRHAVQSIGFEIPKGDAPIIPIILGEESRALEASKRLAEAGLLVPAVRPPTVPKGSSRLRITLSCDHTDAEVQHLLDMLPCAGGWTFSNNKSTAQRSSLLKLALMLSPDCLTG